ncbi:MAG: PKD repeat protein [Bacteroidia bacterium]|jgi:PKD repeat protein
MAIAQSCNPTYLAGNECTNNAISFKANAPGFSSYQWEFKDTEGKLVHSTSNRDPIYEFKDDGAYSVTLKASGSSGNCRKTLNITIKPSPTVRSMLLTDQSQCFAGNQFLYLDSSKFASGSTLNRITYLFGDGAKEVINNPKIGDAITHTVIDPSGGSFNLKIELKDNNGCVTEKLIQNAIQVYPRIGLRLTSNSPVGCDSTNATIKNKTYLNWLSEPKTYVDLKDLAQFTLDFGDGTEIIGDSITNTEFWTGKDFDGIIKKKYYGYGSFNLKLSVVVNNGCTETTTYKRASTVIGFDFQIRADKDSLAIAEGPVTFRLANGPIPGARFFWNFGDPESGLSNFDNQKWNPSHTYNSLGPKMISLRVLTGPCDVMVFDTVVVFGPKAQIEAPNDRIDFERRYQCTMKDTVFFTNNSSFYHNDVSIDGEDSTVQLNGKTEFVFNFNEVTRSGDQTAITSAKHLANRTAGSQVTRLWTFGDEYASQCTTSTALQLNVGRNCNYSLDSAPKHLYPNWDTVYLKHHFVSNDTFTYGYIDSTFNCRTRSVDTTEPQLHRLIFMKSYPHNFVARLTLKDTIRNARMEDEALIVATQPDASRMTLQSSVTCPFDDESQDYKMLFDMNTGSQSYFAVNFDLSKGKDNFIAFNSGGILAPPAPGSALPFSLSYDATGTYGDQFIKGYSAEDLGDDWSMGPTKKITMGLIVGNGPLDKNGEPQCTDTAWYHNLLELSRLDAEFDIVGNKKSICKGEEVYLKLKHDHQMNISTFNINYGYQNRLGGYYEDFKYLQDYDGPVVGRNDENVDYKGENWRYNYVIRHTIDEVFGDIILDTIVTSILKEWKTMLELPEGPFNPAPKKGYYFEDNGLHWSAFLGTCIDTTGMNLKSVLSEYHEQETNVVKHNNKRYRYTHSSRMDSVEVAEILHFRAHSLQGFDTLIDGQDTIPGLWKISYKHPEVQIDWHDPAKKDTVIIDSRGAMIPSISLSNMDGCKKNHAELLNVGFLHAARFYDEVACTGQEVHIQDSIRYWQFSNLTWPEDYPIDPTKYWEDADRYVSNREIKKIDWDSTDGLDFERDISFSHVYNEPGSFIATMVMQDSLGCTDTSYLSITIAEVSANFTTTTEGENCSPEIIFSDSTTHTLKDGVMWYEWNFGDGSPKSVLKKPSHTYDLYDNYVVNMKIRTSLGCEDDVTTTLNLLGPKPLFEFKDDYFWNRFDTAVIYEGNTLFIRNLSEGTASPNYTMNWGDGTIATVAGQEFEHRYNDPGIYNLYLTMEDWSMDSTARCFKTYPDSVPMPWQVKTNEVVVVLEDTTSGVPSLHRQVRLFPNPSQGQFVVQSRGGLIMEQVRLIDAIGRNVPFNAKGLKSDFITVDVSNIATGHYTLIIATKKGLVSKSISVIRP